MTPRNHRLPGHAALTAFAAILAAGSATAATLSPLVPQTGKVPYSWSAVLTGMDTTTGNPVDFEALVGPWSWEDNTLSAGAGVPVGWTHQSKWIALEIDAGTPVSFTIRLERKSDVFDPTADAVAPTDSLFPAFTLWGGWDTDDVVAGNHSYQNREPAVYGGTPFWAEDLSYLTHADNATEEFIERTYTLDPGFYTIAVGGNASSSGSTALQGLGITLTTVPEPSAALLGGLGVLGLLRRRRRA